MSTCESHYSIEFVESVEGGLRAARPAQYTHGALFSRRIYSAAAVLITESVFYVLSQSCYTQRDYQINTHTLTHLASRERPCLVILCILLAVRRRRFNTFGWRVNCFKSEFSRQQLPRLVITPRARRRKLHFVILIIIRGARCSLGVWIVFFTLGDAETASSECSSVLTQVYKSLFTLDGIYASRVNFTSCGLWNSKVNRFLVSWLTECWAGRRDGRKWKRYLFTFCALSARVGFKSRPESFSKAKSWALSLKVRFSRHDEIPGESAEQKCAWSISSKRMAMVFQTKFDHRTI